MKSQINLLSFLATFFFIVNCNANDTLIVEYAFKYIGCDYSLSSDYCNSCRPKPKRVTFDPFLCSKKRKLTTKSDFSDEDLSVRWCSKCYEVGRIYAVKSESLNFDGTLQILGYSGENIHIKTINSNIQDPNDDEFLLPINNMHHEDLCNNFIVIVINNWIRSHFQSHQEKFVEFQEVPWVEVIAQKEHKDVLSTSSSFASTASTVHHNDEDDFPVSLGQPTLPYSQSQFDSHSSKA